LISSLATGNLFAPRVGKLDSPQGGKADRPRVGELGRHKDGGSMSMTGPWVGTFASPGQM